MMPVLGSSRRSRGVGDEVVPVNALTVLGGVAAAALAAAMVWLAWLHRRRGWGTWWRYGLPAAAAAGHLLAAAAAFDIGTSFPVVLGGVLVGMLAGGLWGSRLPQRPTMAGVVSPLLSTPILLWGTAAAALQAFTLTDNAAASRRSLYALAVAVGLLAGLAGTLAIRAQQLPAVAMTMMHCSRCGAPLHPDTSTCPMCGLSLRPRSPVATPGIATPPTAAEPAPTQPAPSSSPDQTSTPPASSPGRPPAESA